MLDLVFPLHGHALPRDHRWALAQALVEALPALAEDPLAAVHPVRLVPGTGEPALLSARARLVLRVARGAAGAAQALAGRRLHVGGCTVQLGTPQQRELLPHTTLYAHFVDAGQIDAGDEAGFLATMGEELARLEVRCQRVCGRAQRLRGPDHTLQGYSLMLHGLREAGALRVLEHGLGAHRLMGCGVFVPHKSAAAVGEID
ncbi:type I-MYXAN CRISPR-associated protein Cas6/Cmx6 [Piscinibacter defluvii]|uniref:type I-MYXAN CRISPR-associated protein Cas6/Cmx6 n=1 Tax=Piscinibacter defluvii TaxID=1796922 RepID=UPI0013E31961|nr:type I-MYXAN CRISPR-associated protein Cas6/Cmx6 [Piscinibacter defluvii]